MIDEIFSSEKLLAKVNKLAIEGLCKQVKLEKKGRIRSSKDRLELAFIRLITPFVSRKKQFEIDCYLTKKY